MNKVRNINYFDIVIIPPPLEKNYAIKLSREIGGGGKGKFILGRSQYVPHISLYHIPVSNRKIKELHNVLKNILVATKLGILTLKKIKIPKEGSIWIEVSKPLWLEELHKRVVKGISGFRDTKFDVREVWGKNYNLLQEKMIVKYGSPYIGRFFQPHITLTVLRDKYSKEKGIKFKQMRFKTSTVSVYHVGLHHSCQKKLFSVYP